MYNRTTLTTHSDSVGVPGFEPLALLAATGPPSPHDTYKAWRKAVESRQVEAVLRLYERADSVLWCTLAKTPLHGRDEIRTYFETFLDRSTIRIATGDCRFRGVANDIVIATGTYTFDLGPPNSGTKSSQLSSTIVPARFTIVFRQQPSNHTWRILEHHSSIFQKSAHAPSQSLS